MRSNVLTLKLHLKC